MFSPLYTHKNILIPYIPKKNLSLGHQVLCADMILLPHEWLSTSWMTLRKVYSKWEVDRIFGIKQTFAHVLSKLQTVI